MPETYQPGGAAFEVHENSSTGGSTKHSYFEFDQKKESKFQQFFRRVPLVTETTALYQASHVLNDLQND